MVKENSKTVHIELDDAATFMRILASQIAKLKGDRRELDTEIAAVQKILDAMIKSLEIKG